MYNNNGKNNHHHYYYNNLPLSSSPRISFSNDFVESQVCREARMPASTCPDAVTVGATSNFEFSVSNHSMTSADELFFKGRILPSYRGGRSTATTLREELLAEDDEEGEGEGEASSRLAGDNSGGGGGRWRGFLGLRKGGKKGDSNKFGEGSGDWVSDDNSSQETFKKGAANKFKK
ncbi:hypothetical protein MLD38_003173 [Melastoma candidum]|uniref:Uncharacterized protein n=1 Tax=Melastoma candidum TaxID=119954 RepID=A0ACB9S5L3_9MYRT|nr:hypothetical protein MLD38_003173 [Melastoma candidum]